MALQNYFLPVILLLGMLQGVINGILLYTRKCNQRMADRLLAWLLFLLSLACLNHFIAESGIYASVPAVRLVMELVPTIVVMPLGPLLYFYTRALTDPEFRMTMHRKLHFLTVLADMVPTIICWVFLVGLLTGFFQRIHLKGWGDVIDEYQAYMDLPRWLSLTVYSVAAWRCISRYQLSVSRGSADRQQFNLRWLRKCLGVFLCFQMVWFLFLIPYLLPAYRPALLDSLSYYPIMLPLAVVVYWLGLKGYLHSRTADTLPASSKAGTGSFTVSPDVINKTIVGLKTAMEEDKLYLDPQLNLDKVVRHLKIDQKTLSHVLNQHLEKSFNTFVNGYRIEAVKQRMLEPSSQHLTLTGIAFEAGFNSQATFQRAFKQMTGMTPKAYLSAQMTE